jgi:hypothetical protein
LTLAVVCVVCGVVPVLAAPQYRPSYFPRPGGFSQELPQYGGEGATDIGNRDNAPPAPGMNNSLDDTQLANRVQEWPRPNQPFWFLNQQHIAQHTAGTAPCQGSGCAPAPIGPAPQSSFLGSGARG